MENQLRKYVKKFNNITIIDGSYFLHRSLHVDQIFNLRTNSGIRSGGVFNVLKMINSELRHSEGFPIVCWDAKLSDRRVQADPDYKHARERSMEHEILTEEQSDNDYLTQYRTQRSMLIDILAYAGIPSLRFDHTEGDDLMYILSKMSKTSKVLTDDRDMLQLITDDCVVRRCMADELYTKERLFEEYKIDSTDDFVMIKSIVGDVSDNIPGCCKGVGGGTAINIVNIFKICTSKDINPRELFSNLDELKSLCKENGIKFFKAYGNFDFDRFNINLELVDLKKVDYDVTDFLLQSIVSIIYNCRNNVNYFSFIKKLGELEIHNLNADELINTVSNKYNNLINRGE